MAKPVLTDSQRTELTAEKAAKQNQQASLTNTAAAQDAEILHFQILDSAFQDLFNWYNDSIIGKYEAERKSIEGKYIASPIVEADIQAVGGNPASGRLAPTPPTTDIVRISEFDGGPLVTTALTENQAMSDQIVPENQILHGFVGTDAVLTPGATVTATAVDGTTTSLDVTDPATACTFTVGNIIEIEDGVTSAVLQVTSVTDTTAVPVFPVVPPPPPPYTYTLGVIVLLAPASTLASGSNVRSDYHGFNNAERTAKTPAFGPYQNIMDVLLARLAVPINARLARLDEQIPAIQGNEDPDGTTTLGTALSNAQASQTYLTGYLVTMDISDTGINALILERGDRATYLLARVDEIVAAFTDQTTNYFDARYAQANNRGNTQRGTLREQQNAANVKAVLQAQAAGLGDAISAYNSIL